MTRTALKPAVKGSQKWLQILVNQYPEMINRRLQAVIGDSDIEWLSPLAGDDFAEYRDQSLLDRLGVVLPNVALSSFWPKNGPRWDGLARTGKGSLLLIEAKSHVREMLSPSRATAAPSKRRIRASLEDARRGLGASPDSDWAGSYYQYTNRLAFYYLLHSLNGLPVHLIFLYFINDVTMNGPASQSEWRSALVPVQKALGIDERLSPYIHDVFLDITPLNGI